MALGETHKMKQRHSFKALNFPNYSVVTDQLHRLHSEEYSAIFVDQVAEHKQ